MVLSVDAQSGILYSYNQTLLCGTSATCYSAPTTFGILPYLSGLKATSIDGKGNSFVTFFGFNDTWLGENYGIPAGTYKPKVSSVRLHTANTGPSLSHSERNSNPDQ